MDDAEAAAGGEAAVSCELARADVSMPATPSSGTVAVPRGGSLARLSSPMRRDIPMRRSTPGLSEVRNSSTPHRTGAHGGIIAAAQAARESTILAVVRQQMEAMEERLSAQINRVQQQCNRTRDTAFAQVDSKLGALEASQPKMDRRLAELAGNFKGLSDEMQAQIRRTDAVETRFWEARQQQDEELRSKLSELEQGFQQASSQMRIAQVAGDDVQRRCGSRLRQLERLVEERLGSVDDAVRRMTELEERVQEAAQEMQDLALCMPTARAAAEACEPAGALLSAHEDLGANYAQLAVVTSRVEDGSQRAARLEGDVQDVQMRLEAQEERLRSLRTMLDRKEDAFRTSKFERTEWESRSKELSSSVQDLERFRAELGERVDLLQRKAEAHEQLLEEATADRAAQRDAHWQNAAATSVANEAVAGDDDTWAGVVQDCAIRLGEAEARLGRAEKRLVELGEGREQEGPDSALGTRVTVLADSLRSMTPKLQDQEMCVQDLIQKVGQLEARVEVAAEHGKVTDMALARGQKVEVDSAACIDIRQGGA